MAKTLSIALLSYNLFLFSSTLASTDVFSRIISPEKLGFKQEKLSHLHFYFHDIVSGPKPSAVRVADAGTVTNKSTTSFGAMVMADDPLTVGPERDSRLVGKAQGIYAFAAQDEVALLMVMNFEFVEGRYNGSYLSLLGRNDILSVREMPIVGGSGVFRFGRGFAKAKTHSFDNATGDAVVEYNVYVFHY